MIVGTRILERLTAVGISQVELGRRVRLHQSTINGLIHGDQQSSTKLHQIARELQTTAAYLSGETDDPNSEAIAIPVISSVERELLDYFRQLESEDRRAIFRLTRSIAKSAPAPTLHEAQRAFRSK